MIAREVNNWFSKKLSMRERGRERERMSERIGMGS